MQDFFQQKANALRRIRSLPLQQEYGCYIIKRNTADHHQRAGGCRPVRLLQIGEAEQCCAAPVGCLHEFPAVFFAKGLRRDDGRDQDLRRRDKKAEHKEPRVPDAPELRLIQLLEDADRQRDLKDEAIEPARETFLYQVRLSKGDPEQDQKKDRHRDPKTGIDIRQNLHRFPRRTCRPLLSSLFRYYVEKC